MPMGGSFLYNSSLATRDLLSKVVQPYLHTQARREDVVQEVRALLVTL